MIDPTFDPIQLGNLQVMMPFLAFQSCASIETKGNPTLMRRILILQQDTERYSGKNNTSSHTSPARSTRELR